MPRKCSVPGCKSNYSSTVRITGTVSTFSFPKEEKRKEAWICAIQRKDWFPSRNAGICAKHFHEKDIILNEIWKQPDGTVTQLALRSPKLSSDAVPSLQMPSKMTTTAPQQVIKTEIKQEDKIVNCFSQSETNYVDSQTDVKIEVKEEPLWDKSETTQANYDSGADLQNKQKDLLISGVVEDGESERLCTESKCRSDRDFTLEQDQSSRQEHNNVCDTGTTDLHEAIEGYDNCEKKSASVNQRYLNKPYKCKLCYMSFKFLSYLEKHILIHDNSGMYQCEFCKKRFKRQYHLKKHSAVHEGKRVCNSVDDKNHYQCKLCERSFGCLSALKHHISTHDDTQHICLICGKTFKYLSILKVHHLVHEDVKPHKCDICGKCFEWLADLKRHKLTHKNVNLRCTICDESFLCLSSLKKHNLIHSRPYKCQICHKSFRFLSSLKYHSAIHKCMSCEQSFRWMSDLKRHYLMIHNIDM